MIHLSQNDLSLCIKSAQWYNKSVVTINSDGIDNWRVICDAVTDEDVIGNYPTFEYVN